ncbi:MAG TPA: RsmE family RNA methyltransferase [Candidatus Methylomirabilis sp.]|nr:RsmE family RNA methyltransferase [Candidatus Methylomirabilis sp.]HSC71709.1 RsmE family RNA methyltransferase [Candidatus Methylomirabilis sp.]
MGDSRIHHRRFFVPAACIRDGGVLFGPAQAHQLTRVLRLRTGDRVSVFDGTGRELLAALERTSARSATARILHELPGRPAVGVVITLAQVIPRGAAMDFIVAKATELGVARIAPLEATQSVRKASARGPRWVRIVQESAEQCGRRDVPEIAATATLGEFLRPHPSGTPLLACHAGEGARPLPELCRALDRPAALTLLVGGEGGLSLGEVGALRSRGALLASLGPRLLRAETAALTALAILQASLGDLVASTLEVP